MSKAYHGKTCAYCAVDGASATGDHVVARQFFPQDRRANLPKVPACLRCNGAKSQLEHYLTTVLPFGGNQRGSSMNLVEMVEPRLAKNRKLHRALSNGMQERYVPTLTGASIKELTIPFDNVSMERLLGLIAQGLSFFHWGLILNPSEFDINAGFLIPEGENLLETMMNWSAAQRVSESLGDGVFTYEGIQAFDRPEITIWRMSFYGAVVAGDPELPHFRTSKAYVSTAKKGFALPLNS